jgi:hypothetical protein
MILQFSSIFIIAGVSVWNEFAFVLFYVSNYLSIVLLFKISVMK